MSGSGVPVDPGAGSPAQAAPWTRLWRSGVLHSCSTAMDGNYEGPVRAFWAAQFGRLANGSVMVDIGTGNGALALLAVEAARARGIGFDVHGVDLADITPGDAIEAGAGAFADIRFHPRTSFTALPFADGGVDLLCSQFAFEYAPRDAAAAEALRVIGRRGGVAMVLHSTDSLIARTSAGRLPWFGHVLRDSPLLPAAAAMLEVLAGARTPAARAALAASPGAEAARKAFNDAAAALLARAAEPGAADVVERSTRAISHALRTAGADPDGARGQLASLRQWLDDEEARLLQLRASLLDDEALAGLAGCFRTAGHDVACGELAQRPDAKLGWTLEVAARG
ncbi:class I SAM-dependent methyltransferase [Luteimonas terricola]|uniref:Methyltransferase domain-containing protein n=1 Tax=Luteimonas terricola TaxID=645597 RepID=A0ABQ2EIF5_9GAMM|nr:class I SAM-dependent methyltransferase [Luteimonas terricola]GGK12455.1 hypothetical protein GCM10011394_22090 [Luteimonas terricola]